MGKYYAVKKGRSTGVYSSWAEAESQVKGYSGAVYKSFTSASAANDFVTGSSAPYNSSAPYKSSTRSRTTVYTDGASRGNGRVGAAAGYGVYYGPGEERNVSAPLPGHAQTNQRAELMGSLVALQNHRESDGPLTIKTDSMYTINAVTEWGDKWERNGWKNSNGKPVANQDLIKAARSELKNKEATLEYVPGHSGDPGNEAADRLAVQGALKGMLRSNSYSD